MGKRLNPHRRLLARQAALKASMMKHGNADDAGKLQEGRVRSPQGRKPLWKHYTRPHSKFGDEPPKRPRIPGSGKLNRY